MAQGLPSVTNGDDVREFEQAFAEFVGARYAIALCNGTATLHTALVAMGVQPGDHVAVPPLTMSATTLAVLQAGAIPQYVDVEPDTWLMGSWDGAGAWAIPVSLYGLHQPFGGPRVIDDAAQTLRPHGGAGFTSYSFQASKILPLGEGGMLVTDNDWLATRAREFSSLGYRMDPAQPRIDPAVLKDATYERHHWPMAYNYRMSDLVAREGYRWVNAAGVTVQRALNDRRTHAGYYAEAVKDCPWLTPQRVAEGRTHDYWTYAVAADTPIRARRLAAAVVQHGGERPYAAWRLAYQEPAFRHLAVDGTCPVAERLQPRLLQFQTNHGPSALRNAVALARAIREVGET